jgi:outer membrane lipopolysaccharide assembly protein LptE/RlpB
VNKLFRSFNLTNEQKSKVVETLDRTKNVREVKLVFSTIAESFKFGTGATKKVTAKLTESYASKPAASTAPKQIISEDNSAAMRFKKLAGIIK